MHEIQTHPFHKTFQLKSHSKRKPHFVFVRLPLPHFIYQVVFILWIWLIYVEEDVIKCTLHSSMGGNYGLQVHQSMQSRSWTQIIIHVLCPFITLSLPVACGVQPIRTNCGNRKNIIPPDDVISFVYQICHMCPFWSLTNMLTSYVKLMHNS